MLQERAIVIGGSVAGLLAARVCADFFKHVAIVERDELPAEPFGPRKGLPQANHQHILLMRGRELLEAFFPGFDQDLAALGAPQVDYTLDCLLVSSSGRLPRFPSQIHLRLCRRPLIDWVLRQRVEALPNVTFLDGYRALGFRTEGSARITGLAVEPTGPKGKRVLPANLVVDASGRGSRTPRWLRSLDCPSPEAEAINPFLGYASRLYERPKGAFSWKAVEVASRPPHNRKAAGLWEVEEGRWLLTLIGTARDYPPLDEAGFLAFAQALPDPIVFEAIRQARPISPILGTRGMESRWHHYERLAACPEGLVVLGDALCAFNPTHGQGMTVAALGARMLGMELAKGNSTLVGLGARVHRATARILKPVWMLATSDDFRWPTTEGGSPGWSMRLLHRYQDWVMPLGPENPELVETFLSVANLIKPPSALLKPCFLGRLGAQWLRMRISGKERLHP